MTIIPVLEVFSLGLAGVADAPPGWVALLDDSERERLFRLRRPEDRVAYAAAHALLRVTLGACINRLPSEVRFTTSFGRKPRLDGDVDGRSSFFNLSHAEGMVAVALSDTFEVGIDVEATDRTGVDQSLAAFAFAPAEADALRDLDGTAWRAAFFRLWTAKEAVAKAVGLGLALPMADIAIDEGTERATLTGAAVRGVGDAVPRTWALWHRPVAPRHRLTVAVPACGLADGAPSVAWTHLDAAGFDAMVGDGPGRGPEGLAPDKVAAG